MKTSTHEIGNTFSLNAMMQSSLLARGHETPVCAQFRRSAPVKSIFSTICLWLLRSESRRQLQHLNDRMLDDIGISRHQARQEAEKPFWQA